MHLFVTAPKYCENLLAEELKALGATQATVATAGVTLDADLALAYRICLWSRVANRVLLELATFAAPDPDALYRGVASVAWLDHMAARNTLAVDATVQNSQIDHSHFAALKVKDAVVDTLRNKTGQRPSIDTEAPDIRLNLYLNDNQATLSLDLSGESLHRRGYREPGAPAPLKENLAAALLLRSGWPELWASGAAFADPMCGSGTLVIEAALIAGDLAPGLLRRRFGFHAWRQHQPKIFEALAHEMHERARVGRAKLGTGRFHGSDVDPQAIAQSRGNARRAGLAEHISLDVADITAAKRPAGAKTGLVVTNPPYGERVGEAHALIGLYRNLGARLQTEFAGWQAAVLTSEAELGFATGLRATKKNAFMNGAIATQLLRFDLSDDAKKPAERKAPAKPFAEDFKNRLSKNHKQLAPWAEKNGITCYRLYDADLPDYAMAIDLYATSRGPKVHVQEYQAPKTVDPRKARLRLQDALDATADVLGVGSEALHLKTRRPQKGKQQYRKQDDLNEFLEVKEGGHTFLVNLSDYLDTGLFLDHRLTRALLAELAPGKRFLNLFGYTATATVYAAKAGAKSTTTVDLSATYLRWAQQNLAKNGITGPTHRMRRADCLTFLTEHDQSYGLIFLDPPTFSNSKAMEQVLDLQRDHVQLIRDCVALLDADGVLIFSNNFRRFKLDTAALADLVIQDITAETTPKDFARKPAHQCFRISRA